jgi:hypothetical protein
MMTENAEQRLAEAHEHQWLGEVNALEESVVHNIGVVCQLARNDALVDALPSPNPGSRIGAELGLSARAVFGR